MEQHQNKNSNENLQELSESQTETQIIKKKRLPTPFPFKSNQTESEGHNQNLNDILTVKESDSPELKLQKTLCAFSSLIQCDLGKKYYTNQSNPIQVRSPRQLNYSVNHGFNITCDLTVPELLCYDIDNPIIAEATLEMIKQLQLNCFATKTPRNGCHIFFQKNRDDRITKNGNVVTALGFQCELFYKKSIVMFGPGYTTQVEPHNGYPLGHVPDILRPLTQRCTEVWVQSAVLLKGMLIPEGERNNTLFKYAQTIRRHPKSFLNGEEVLNAIATFYCDPPYTEPIDHMLNFETKENQAGLDKEDKPNKIAPDSLYEFLGPYKLVYIPLDDSWFKSDPETRLWVQIDEYDLRIYLRDVFKEMGTSNTTLNTIKTMIEELKGYCKYREVNFPQENGLAFSNGWLDVRGREFKPHEYLRFVRLVVQFPYHPNAMLGEPMKQILLDWFGGSYHYLNHLRGFLARAILMPSGFRSALFISGPPKSGKSTMARIFEAIAGQGYIVLNQGHKAFDKALYKGARVLVLNDCTSMDQKTRDLLRQLTGNDRISYEIKFVQVSSEHAFQYRGIVVVISNNSKHEMISSRGDVALAQRFVEIPFENIPSADDINPHLFEYILSQIVAIVNWSLCVDCETMKI